MKKKFCKSFVAFAAVAVVGFGSYKAYGSYLAANMSEEDLLLAENVEALSETQETGYGEICVRISGGPCYVRTFGPKEYIPNTEGKWLMRWWYEQSGEWEQVTSRKPLTPWEKSNCKVHPDNCPGGLKTMPTGDAANGTIYGDDNA